MKFFCFLLICWKLQRTVTPPLTTSTSWIVKNNSFGGHEKAKFPKQDDELKPKRSSALQCHPRREERGKSHHLWQRSRAKLWPTWNGAKGINFQNLLMFLTGFPQTIMSKEQSLVFKFLSSYVLCHISKWLPACWGQEQCLLYPPYVYKVLSDWMLRGTPRGQLNSKTLVITACLFYSPERNMDSKVK